MARRRIERLRGGNAAAFFVHSYMAFQAILRERMLKLAFRTLSMARRHIERLRGVQFCRRTTEIRSEVSRPPDLFRSAWLEN